MKIAVLFDGAGLARLGLEQAGHDCTGYELDPWKHYLSLFVGSGNSMLADVRDVDLSSFDAVWASPPCQNHSVARTQGAALGQYAAADLFKWSCDLPHDVLWVENVISGTTWGTAFNAAQFELVPRQNRNRYVAGRYRHPHVYRPYRRTVPGLCPCITASEQKGCASDTRRASRYYGRRLTLQECAYHQGFTIPGDWAMPPHDWPGTAAGWRNQQYQAIGNGVPPFMALAFGSMHA